METMNGPGYYAIIPADVRYSKIPGNAKLLYGEITALCGKEGYCYAKNEYFAELYESEERTIRRWISALSEAGFVEVREEEGQRRIYLPEAWTKMSGGEDKNVRGGGQKCPALSISNKKSSNARVREEKKIEKNEEIKKAWDTFLSEHENDEIKPASVAVYLNMVKIGFVPTETPEDFRRWLSELAALKSVTASELETISTEWRLYWEARPEKPVKNHKTSFMNSINFSKKTWTNEPSKK